MSDGSDVRTDTVGQHISSLSGGLQHNLEAKYIFNQLYYDQERFRQSALVQLIYSQSASLESQNPPPSYTKCPIRSYYCTIKVTISYIKPELDIRITSMILC
uniref:AlNc14C113G6457 protein n=1 Tax=Albugo laibachii Nc14 TaxID=890382 RepID=F0WIS2_9STRA|nr:AlNc14C113G6457 [Albugo laibachii Nc14]|eukprot:CCA21166.1 AlNc14C113G6457 [Albugo laibachii Nc14]